MNRELWLLRHGKAERYDGNEDYDRCLKKRGKRDAVRLGEWLKQRALLPDLVISSPANRAIMTAKLVCDGLDIKRQHIQTEKRLYDEGLVRVKSVLSDCPATFNRVLLVGHNPELEELLNLPGRSRRSAHCVEKLLPTCASGKARLCRMIGRNWKKRCAELVSITYPKSLTDEIEEPV